MEQVFKLKKPYTFNNEEHDEFKLDLDRLTGADLIKVETDLLAQGKGVQLNDLSKLYLSRVAAKAASLPYAVMERLAAKDFNQIVTHVLLFLHGQDSPIAEESEGEKEEIVQEESCDEPLSDSTDQTPESQ